MKSILALAFVVAAFAAVDRDVDSPALNKWIIDEVNADSASTWQAGVNEKFLNMNLDQVKRELLGVLEGSETFLREQLPTKPAPTEAELRALPAEYDIRKEWGSRCPTTVEIRDQANCGSCWAFGAVSAMSDRYCILSNGTVHVHLSAQDLTSCCGSCGFGCNGGYPSMAWSYWVNNGIVTGGNYNGGQCYPYAFAPCDHHVDGKYGPCPATAPTPACKKECQNGASWNSDKYYGSKSYGVPARMVDIQNELFYNGPTEVAFSVYEDFLTYKSGVYQRRSGRYLGGHAVKLMGWGTENGTPYWIVANSWNEGWGDQGYFKILRGSNECGIEGQVVAGLPKF